MQNKLLIIISTGEAGKAHAGTMYAVNALKHAWMDEVKLYFFGPAEELLVKDKYLQELVAEYQNENESAIACKFVAQESDIGDQVKSLGVEVQYVGEQISSLIKAGYTPMVW